MKKKLAAKVALMTILLLFVIAAVFIAMSKKAHAAEESPWDKWGVAPYATSLEEACKKAPTAIDGFNLPTAVKEHFKQAIGADCKSSKEVWLTPDMLLEQMWSGGQKPHVMNNKKVAELPVKKSPDGRPYRKGSVAETAKAQSWSFVHDGKTYILYLPSVCFNWSWAFAPAPAPMLSPPKQVDVTTITAGCPNGFTMFLHVRSFSRLPNDLQAEAERLIKIAEARDTNKATNPDGYKGDDVSRTLYAKLSRLPDEKIDVQVSVQILNSMTLEIEEDLGTREVTAAFGWVKLTANQLTKAVQTIWPSDFRSPPVSGGKRRIILLPDEWRNNTGGRFCSKHIMVLAQ